MEHRTLTPAAREARNAYRRAWAKINRDKIREQQRRYWEKKAATAAEDPEAETTTIYSEKEAKR